MTILFMLKKSERDMYAVIADSAKQYRVEQGQRLLIDLRATTPGETIEFDRVLVLMDGEKGAIVGQPTVSGAKVVAEVVGPKRMKKIHVGFYKKRKNYRRHRGHRQTMTEILVKEIVAG